MRAAGRLGRGERARVAAQVRSLVSGSGTAGPAARTMPIPRATAEPVGDLDDAGDGEVSEGEVSAGERAGWLPGPDLDRRVPSRRPVPEPRSSLGERLRWNPGRRGAAALGLLVIVLVAAAGWWLASAKPQELPVATVAPSASAVGTNSSAQPVQSGPPSGSVSASSASNPMSSSSAALVIDVAGKVRRPGIYLLPPGSRVYDALRAAGGVRPGVSTVSLNLAEPLRDGEQIVVGVPGAGAQAPAQTGGAGTSGGSSPAGAVVDINTATLDQLDSLPGVGPSTAQKILDYRSGHGAFTSIDQLQNVSGIGPAKFAAMKALVTV